MDKNPSWQPCGYPRTATEEKSKLTNVSVIMRLKTRQPEDLKKGYNVLKIDALTTSQTEESEKPMAISNWRFMFCAAPKGYLFPDS